MFRVLPYVPATPVLHSEATLSTLYATGRSQLLLLLLGVLPLWLLLVDVVCATLQAKIGAPVWVQVLQHYLYNRDPELAQYAAAALAQL